ncbi:hypothetical protein GQ54DRAFT_297293 [Martensiomyces pterosporus]|nr:hypothetical protein GQ54DRAFT_297293 [Martensiomyces pterosporus]
MKGLAPEQKRELLKEIRRHKKQSKTLPWFLLSAKYHMSAKALQRIYKHDKTEKRKERKLSREVTKMANRHYDKSRRRCNWESVSQELGLPVLDCLRHFSPDKASFEPQSIRNRFEWPDEYLPLLQAFSEKYFDGIENINWVLASVYLNVKYTDADAMDLDSSPSSESEEAADKPMGEADSQENGEDDRAPAKPQWQMTREIFLRIWRYRDAGVRWDDMLGKFPELNTDLLALRTKFSTYKYCLRLKGELSSTVAGPSTVAGKPASKEKLTIENITSTRFRHLQELVREHGEDWDLISDKMMILASDLRRCWKGYTVDTEITSGWTEDEDRLLLQCADLGMGGAEAARHIGTKLPHQCVERMRLVKKKYAVPEKAIDLRKGWNEQDDAELLRLTEVHTDGTFIRWEKVAEVLGYNPLYCRARKIQLDRAREASQPDKHRDKISREVQRQHEAHGKVDWGKVSKATGFSVVGCLENSTYGEGKARWVYDPDTYSEETADSMLDFIDSNYRDPLPTNYTAVSNYMWINIDDCIKMHKLVDGKFEWTEEAIQRVRQRREQGATYTQIARELSPKMGHRTVASMLCRTNKNMIVRLTPEQKRQVHEIVGRHAGKETINDIYKLARQEMTGCDGNEVFECARNAVVKHPYYQKVVSNADHESIFDRIASGDATNIDIASELGVPVKLISRLLQSKQNESYTIEWTDDELQKLAEFVKSSKGKMIQWARLSKIIGTKSRDQCKYRYYYLKESSSSLLE